MGRALQEELELLRVSKQLKYSGIPTNQLATFLEQPFMQFSNVSDHAVQDDLNLLRMLKHLMHFWYLPRDGPCS